MNLSEKREEAYMNIETSQEMGLSELFREESSD